MSTFAQDMEYMESLRLERSEERIELIRNYAAMLMRTSDVSKLYAGLQTIRNGAYARMQSELNRDG